MLGEVAKEDATGGSALEGHVLEEVGHAGFAIALVARANAIDHVDGDLGLGVVREQERVKAVGECVLGDALDRSNFCDTGGQRLRGDGNSQKEDGEEESNQPESMHGNLPLLGVRGRLIKIT